MRFAKDFIKRVAGMEAAYDRVRAGKARRTDPGRLRAYMESGQWRLDFEADEAGLLPKDLKRGVLSEDGLYDLLEELDLRRKQLEK